MTLYVTIHTSVSGEIERWSATNIGHPDTGGRPPDDDLRRYLVRRPDGTRFHVNHRRRLGARVLAASILHNADHD